MYVDKIKIKIKAGDGGNGCTSFYTEKYVAKGGPDGGDGGRGGDIIFVADAGKTSLLDFHYANTFVADSGERGQNKYCHGKSAKNLEIKVPLGTVIRDFETGKIIADMFAPDDRITVLEGGSGGKGNARFKTSQRQAPRFSQSGQKTEMKQVVLELKTIADVGLLGYPNVGKSTLLSVISSAKPKIANYHFTTLSPNLGVVKYYDDSFVVADIPGLIEGAGEGVGLGHDFLRHVDRTRLLVHVVDISASEDRDPVTDYKKINAELKKYDEALSKVPQVIALNKADIPGSEERAATFKQKVRKPAVLISAATRQGIDELIETVYIKLKELPPVSPLDFEPFVYERPDTTRFEISRDDDGAFVVFGGMIDEMARNIVLDDFESMKYFQLKLKENGIIKALRKEGAKDGDTVRIMDIEFDFVE